VYFLKQLSTGFSGVPPGKRLPESFLAALPGIPAFQQSLFDTLLTDPFL
jgi:hypothetical protein